MVKQFEFRILNGLAQSRTDDNACPDIIIRNAPQKPEAFTRRLFGLKHGHLGPVQNMLDFKAIIRVQAYANTQRDDNFLIIDNNRLTHCRSQIVSKGVGYVMVPVGDDHNKIVTTQSADYEVASALRGKALGHGL